ncbi:MAG: hypothetical protein KDK55_01415 [Chlamydiia bacterium]|nr:hypothetical protein [Chlamydiia bacterium]
MNGLIKRSKKNSFAIIAVVVEVVVATVTPVDHKTPVTAPIKAIFSSFNSDPILGNQWYTHSTSRIGFWQCENSRD